MKPRLLRVAVEQFEQMRVKMGDHVAAKHDVTKGWDYLLQRLP